jgi:hypothetical protein
MVLSPLHRLAEMIRQGEFISDQELLEVLGPDGTVAVPLQGGGERHLPSGEILAVLADGTGLSIDQVLSRSFRMSPQEVEAAYSFFRLVQFTGEPPDAVPEIAQEQPLQPLDH